jgi:hypothetical protein
MDRLPEDAGAGPVAVLSRFRADFHACLTARADELFELADAVLCADGPVRNLARLSLGPEHRRGHGALYDAVNCGGVEIGRLRRSLAGLPLPRAAVPAGQSDRQGDALAVGDHMMLGPGLGAVDRAGPGLGPPFSARTCEPSAADRSQSMAPVAFSRASSTSCSRCHTPA